MELRNPVAVNLAIRSRSGEAKRPCNRGLGDREAAFRKTSRVPPIARGFRELRLMSGPRRHRGSVISEDGSRRRAVAATIDCSSGPIAASRLLRQPRG
jgi:hypothetical protein